MAPQAVVSESPTKAGQSQEMVAKGVAGTQTDEDVAGDTAAVSQPEKSKDKEGENTRLADVVRC